MELLKYDLCKPCRNLQLDPNFTFEGFLESDAYNNAHTLPLGYYLTNQMILTNLEKKNGCSSCISFLRYITQLDTPMIPFDIISAVKKKAESGDAEAMLNLALKLSFNYGCGQRKDNELEEEASKWIEKAANLGNAEAQYEWAGVHMNERNDLPKAFEWFKKSAQNGYTKAKNNLGSYYLKGEGTPRNAGQAFYWKEQASNDGYLGAKRTLGLLYIEDNGVSVNIDKEGSLLEEAAELGDKAAKEILQKLCGD